VALPPIGVLTVRSADAEHVIALYRPILIAHFARTPRENELATLRAIIDEARAENAQGGMLMIVARRDVRGGIQPHVREFFEQSMRRDSGRFGASAVVVRMAGFGGSLMRSFLTGLLLIARKRDQLRIFEAVDAACAWLAKQHGIDEAALRRAYDQATAQLAVIT
jgi:hypothetical protein